MPRKNSNARERVQNTGDVRIVFENGMWTRPGNRWRGNDPLNSTIRAQFGTHVASVH